MKIAAFAPHLSGRMLPGMFDYLGIGQGERFPGDPAAHQEPWAAWFWMHSTLCTKDEKGCLHGLYRSKTIPGALREHHAPTIAPMPTKRRAPAPRRASTTEQCDLFATP